MQTQHERDIKNAAKRILTEKKADRVAGFAKGEFAYDPSPCVFYSADEIEQNMIYDCFCGANLSKFLYKEAKKEGKIAVFMKPCDTYSLNQLITEHKIDREKIYVFGIDCNGMADVFKLRNKTDSALLGAYCDNGVMTVKTADGDIKFDFDEVIAERCLVCKSKKHVYFDELLCDPCEDKNTGRFDAVEKLEAMSAEQRYEFFRSELSRCIRCNACRDACPACTCETCVFEDRCSGAENKAISNEFEEKLFHIIRAYHVAGRCTDCGECSRVCPQRIPLHLLNRKFIRDINVFYGEYQAGAGIGQIPPLTDKNTSDPEV